MKMVNKVVLAAAVIGVGNGISLSDRASAQEAAEPAARDSLTEIVVTARRRDERLQDVPISMVVFNQDQLSQRNVVNASDLALYTPGLTTNTRFGDDSSSFAIRGFTQELRTTASVGVYFADVVAPRGGPAVTNGDGAGPGAYFDLDNVQVLKGPQGTLFGRNTTGGAVLLIPKKPTHELEGYVEGSLGNYDMKRFQGVVNIPVNDSLRVRLGIDHQDRDGYLKNVSGIGPSRLADLDYTTVRASLVWDVTDTIENYSILSYTDSDNNGSVSQVFACNPQGTQGFSSLLGPLCQAQLDNQPDGYFDVASAIPDHASSLEQWQLINTTTWEVNDHLTVKNIISYAEMETELSTGVFGTNFSVPTFSGAPFASAPTGSLPFYYANSGTFPGYVTAHQKTFVEELQFQGQAFDDRLVWQAGIYYERSKPDSATGGQSVSNIACDLDSLQGDPADFRCNDYIGVLAGQPIGLTNRVIGGIDYDNRAAYLQSTYALTEQWSITGGIRYTRDVTRGDVRAHVYRYPGSPMTGMDYFPTLSPEGVCSDPGASLPDCRTRLKQTSSAPTWMLGVDFKPHDDLLLYAKYARGYRQGSVNIVGVSGLNTHDEEQVDTYEVGAKLSFAGAMPGFFNISAFYNDFEDQQIQLGLFPTTGVPTTGIVNAGSSTIWGLEVETAVSITDRLNLAASYTYLDTEVDELNVPPVPAGVLAAPPSLTATEGEPLPFSPEHQLALTASYHLPIPEAMGDMALSATWIYTSSQQAVASFVTPFYKVPSYDILNINLDWKSIGSSPFDASLFMTNALNEKYHTFVSGQHTSTGFEARMVGQPRMYGMRVRYSF